MWSAWRGACRARRSRAATRTATSPGAMLVAFGPKKIKFKGRVTVRDRFRGEDRLAAWPWRRGHARRTDRGEDRLSRCATIRRPRRRPRSSRSPRMRNLAACWRILPAPAVSPFANALMQDFARRAAEEFATDAPAPQAAASTGARATRSARSVVAGDQGQAGAIRALAWAGEGMSPLQAVGVLSDGR